MALGFSNLSEKNRRSLFITILSFNSIQLTLGLILFILGVQVDLITWKLTPLEKREIDTIFLVIALFALLVMINQFIAIKIDIKAYRRPYRRFTRNYVFYWIMLGLFIVLDGVLIASLCMPTSERLAEQIKVSLSRGLGQYLTDPTWHRILDEIQQGYECCGVESFVDWHQTPWILMDFLMEDSETVLKYAEPDARILPPVTPWSCCRPDYEYPCFHDPIQQARFAEVWSKPHYGLDSLHHRGCAALVAAPFALTLFAVLVLNLLVLVIQLAITLVLRLLYTSSRNAAALGAMDATAPGWIVGRGDFGFVGGAPISGGAIKQKSKKRAESAELTLKPGYVLEAESDANRRASNRTHSPLSNFTSKVKNRASKAKTCILIKIDKLKKGDQTQRKPESSSEEERSKSPEVKVLMSKKTKNVRTTYSTDSDSIAQKEDGRKRKRLKTKLIRKLGKSMDRKDRIPLLKKKNKK